MSRRVAGAISRFVRESSPNTVAKVRAALAKGDLDPSGTSLENLASSPSARARLRGLAEACRAEGVDHGPSLALALDAASVAHEDASRGRSLEVIWTGPSSESIPVRRSDRALIDLIDGATKSMLVVSFAAYRIESVVASLQKAVQRGVLLDLVLESSAASGGGLTFDAKLALKELSGAFTIWEWPADKRPRDKKGNPGKLHAKCAVADAKRAIVTSANLTEHALDLNMELGIGVRGDGIPERIEAHFRELMRDDHLRRVN